jgi:acyl carrier protein
MKNLADIVRQVTQFIMSDVASPAPATPPDPDFGIIEGGLLDSLGLFKVIAFAEEQFGIRIAPEEIVLENFSTINAIANLIQSKANSANPA